MLQDSMEAPESLNWIIWKMQNSVDKIRILYNQFKKKKKNLPSLGWQRVEQAKTWSFQRNGKEVFYLLPQRALVEFLEFSHLLLEGDQEFPTSSV